jgi:hypothetical protein
MENPSLAAGRPVISVREKTASASESLANNLAANAAVGEETVHGSTMALSGLRRQEGAYGPISATKSTHQAAMINHY